MKPKVKDKILMSIAYHSYSERLVEMEETLVDDFADPLELIDEQLKFFISAYPNIEEWTRESLGSLAKLLTQKLHREGYGWGFVDGIAYAEGLTEYDD